MLTERRLVLSFVSTNLLANNENALLVSRSHLRHQSAPSRRRCAHTAVSNSHSLDIAASTYRRRTRRRTSRLAPYNVHMATSNQEIPPFPPTQPRLVLPRQLVRPRFRAIDPRAVVAVDPVLEGIPLSYIQHSLKDIGPQLLRATCNATATPPAGQLPRELRLICNDVSIEPPSHVLAAYSSVNARVTLFPAHALVLATSCAHLPTLPVSKPDTPTTSGDSVTLPVVPLRIPSPASFPTLLSYLYTKRADHLLTELLPAQNTSSLAQLARAHATSFPVKVLIADARKVHGLWSNATALGIFDDKLFRALEMAWEVLLNALALSSGQSVDAGINVDGELE